MASKKSNIKKIEEAKSIEELVEIGHSIDKKDKDIDRSIRNKMNELLSGVLK